MANELNIKNGLNLTNLDSRKYVPASSLQSLTLTASSLTGEGVIQGNLLFVPTTVGVEIIDISRPGVMEIKSTIACPMTMCLNVQGKYLYLIQNQVAPVARYFRVYDITDPVTPVLVTSLAVRATGHALIIDGRFAYVASEPLGSIITIDISAPNAPVVYNTAAIGSWMHMVHAGDFIYAWNIGDNSIRVIKLTSGIPTLQCTWAISGLLPVIGKGTAIGKYLYYLVKLNEGVGVPTSYLSIADLSDTRTHPTVPVLATYQVGPSGADTVFDALLVMGKYAFISRNNPSNQLFVIDISNPGETSPTSYTIPITVRSSWLTALGQFIYSLDDTGPLIRSYYLGGIYVTNMDVGSIRTTDLQVMRDTKFLKDVSVYGRIDATSLHLKENITVQDYLYTGGQVRLSEGKLLKVWDGYFHVWAYGQLNLVCNNGNNGIFIKGTGQKEVSPINDGQWDLGNSYNRFQNFYLSGTAYINTGILLWADNADLKLGAGQDASIYYDGTDLCVNPKLVGTGKVKLLGELDMGINAISNVGNVDGVDVSAHTHENSTNQTRLASKDRKRQAQVRISSTALGSTFERAIFSAPEACTITKVGIITDTALTGADTDYCTLKFMDKGSGGAGTDVIGTRDFTNGNNTVAFDLYDSFGTLANTGLAAGDVVTIKKEETGNGLATPDMVVVVEYTID